MSTLMGLTSDMNLFDAIWDDIPNWDNKELVDSKYVDKCALLNTSIDKVRFVKNPAEENLLLRAIKYNRMDYVKALIEAGCNLDLVLNIGMYGERGTCLIEAIKLKNEKAAIHLINAGASIDAPSLGEIYLSLLQNRYSPLAISIQKSTHEVTKLLIEKGASLDGIDVNTTVLDAACIYGEVKVLQLINAQSGRLKSTSFLGVTKLHQAASSSHDNSEVIHYLVQNGIKVDLRDENAVTPLMYACDSVNIENAKTLISLGADVNAQDKLGMTPLFHLLKQKRSNIEDVSELIDLGADVNLCDFKESSPLMFAISEGDNDSVRLLLQKGANPNHVNYFNSGYSVFHVAVMRKDLQIIEMLINAGSDPYIKNFDGIDSFELAELQEGKQGGSVHNFLCRLKISNESIEKIGSISEQKRKASSRL